MDKIRHPFRHRVVAAMKPLIWWIPTIAYLAFAPWEMDVLTAIVWGMVAFGLQVNWSEWFYVPFMNRLVMPWASLPYITRPAPSGIAHPTDAQSIEDHGDGIDTVRDPAYSLYLENFFHEN